MLNIVKDIDLINDIPKYDYTIIPTNCYCIFGNGFASKVKRLYPYTFEYDKRTNYADKNKLGSILEVNYFDEPKFIIAYVSFGINFRPDLQKDYLDYNALTTVIKKLDIIYKDKNIAAPFIGCNKYDGNGDKEKVLNILKKNVNNFKLTIYDYFQRRENDEEMDWFKITRFIKEYVGKKFYKVLIDEDNIRKNKEKERIKNIKQYFKDNINNISIKLI